MAKSTTTRTTNPAPQTAIVSDVDAFEATLLRLALMARDLEPKLLKSGSTARAFTAKCEESLGAAAHPAIATAGGAEPDAEAFVNFGVGLLRSLGVLAERDGRLVLDGMAADEFFLASPETRETRLRSAWLDCADFNEFLVIPTLDVAGAKPGATLDRADCVPGVERMKSARTAVLAALEELPLARWTRAEALLDAVERRTPDFLVPRDNTPIALARDYVGIRAKGEKIDLPREGNWTLVEGALIAQLARLPLHFLGWLDAGELAKGGLGLRRRSTVREERATPVSDKPLIVNANYEVMALLPEMDLAALWQLARVSTLASFTPEVANFRIEEAHVAAALNRGITLDALAGFLETRSKSGLAQNVRYSLGEWARRTERITIWLDCVLFEAEGVENLDTIVRPEWRARTSLKTVAQKHLVAPFATVPDPRGAAAPRYPLLDYSRALPAVVTAEANGVLWCAPEAANFRVRRALSKVAEPLSIERWHLTRESVTRAVQASLPYDRMFALLASVVKNELPAPLRVRLAAWTGRAGTVGLADSKLLTFEDRDVAMLLASDPELADLLGTPLNPRTWIVAAEDEAALKEKLAALSLDVSATPARQTHFGTPEQLARVVRPPQGTSRFDTASFARLWQADRMAALELAAGQGGRLALTIAGGKDGPRKVTGKVQALLRYDGGAYVDVQDASGTRQVIPAETISEAYPA